MSKARRINPIQNNRAKKALIYCRVSSERQVNEGHGLDSQEARCMRRAAELGLEVDHVFRDEGVSGRLFDRPAMHKLIGYIDEHPINNFVVIFDDLSRFARDVRAHIKLRREFDSRGVQLNCLNLNLEDTEEGELVEYMMASVHQYDVKKNRRQVLQKMGARLEAGYWPFASKKGYTTTAVTGHGKMQIRNHEGDVLAEAMEGFASGLYTRKIDVVRFLMSTGFWTKQRAEKYITKITEILKDPFYAGYIEYPAWDVERVKGKHEGIISLETFELIQKRLSKTDFNKRVRIDISPDFPLRGLIIHDECKGHITSGYYPNGKGSRYRKYVCHTKNCPTYNKPFTADIVEERFDAVLKGGALKKEIDAVVKEMFNRVWKDEVGKLQRGEDSLEQQKRAHENKLAGLTDLLLKAKTDPVKKNLEKQIEDEASELERITNQSISGVDLQIPYQTALVKVTLLLKKPDVAWKKLNIHEKHGLFFFLFQEKLSYSITEGYQTQEIPYSARLFSDFVEKTTPLVDTTRNSWNPIMDWVLRSYGMLQALENSSF